MRMRPAAMGILLAVMTAACPEWCSRAMAAAQSARTAQDKVDINHASVADLRKIPGMTQTWAARIVRFRPYRTKLDLLERGVVSSQVYDRIKDFIIAHRQPQ